MKKNVLLSILLIMAAWACVDRFDIEDSSRPGFLVVEGVFSNQLKRHQVFLSRATGVNQKNFLRERGAKVSIVDDNQEELLLTEVTDGVYETLEIAADPARTYTLRITTADGNDYSSSAEEFADGPDLNNVYARYGPNPNGEGKGVQVYLDTNDPENRGHYYRWNYIETYEVRAPFTSNWVWLGGTDVEFRVEGIDTCFVSDTLRSVVIRDTHALTEDKFEGFQLRFINETSYILRHRYSILVQQFIMSEKAYHYWENLRLISEEQGGLSDRQPGSLDGNITSTTNPTENVLGYFEVGRASEQRIFFSAITFYNDGMRMPRPLRPECFDIPFVSIHIRDLPVEMPKYEQLWYIWEVDGMSPNTIINLRPKSCCDCRNLGPTERPDFFE